MKLDLDDIDLDRVEAVLDTDKGRIALEFFADKAPATTANFVKLANDGFYDGLRFHRIIKDFMVQGGCPRGDGTGGPGWTIDAEFNDTPHERGVVSMARARHPDSAGSQFFIVHGERVSHLDGQYTAFARVTDGLDVLDALASVPTKIAGATGERSAPAEEITIRAVELRLREARDPEDAPAADDAESSDAESSNAESNDE